MDTETLNQYIFARLVGDFANAAKAMRVAELRANGAGNDIIDDLPLIEDDFREGLEQLESYREVTFAVLSKSSAEPPATG